MDHSTRLHEESPGLTSCVGHWQSSQALPCLTTPGHLGTQNGLHGGTASATHPISAHWSGGSWLAPRPCMHHAGHRLQLADLPLPTQHQPCPRQAPHLLGLSLRLVLRALKLSFSGVSSKDRRTLERRPWQSGTALSWRLGELTLEAPEHFLPLHLSAQPTYTARLGQAADPGQRQQLLPTTPIESASQQARQSRVPGCCEHSTK